jgi:hypothetical protein
MDGSDIIRNLVSHGRNALDGGELGLSKIYALELAKHLDTYIPSDQDMRLVTSYLRDILSVQQVASWRERGKPEYFALRDLVQKRLQDKDDLISKLDQMFA